MDNNLIEAYNNSERKKIKIEKISEIYDFIIDSWKNNKDLSDITYDKKNDIFWKETNLSKSYKILINNWYIENYSDYEKKILNLSKSGYSYDQIWKAIGNICEDIDINIKVKLHKNTVKRFIDRIIDEQKITI